MDINDKVHWLETHGRIVKYNDFSGYQTKSALWKSNGGVYCRGEGETQDEVWESLFKHVKESLFMSANE